MQELFPHRKSALKLNTDSGFLIFFDMFFNSQFLYSNQESGDKLADLIVTVSSIEYLNYSEALTSKLEATGRRKLQNLFRDLIENRKQQDGSFTLGSSVLWMTAYSHRLMNQLKNHVPIDRRHIYNALMYLRNKQQSDGSFLVEQVPGDAAMSQFISQICTTAFIAISFLENREFIEDFQPTIDKALSYIDMKLPQVTNNFDLAISCYALALNGVGIFYTKQNMSNKKYL